MDTLEVCVLRCPLYKYLFKSGIPVESTLIYSYMDIWSILYVLSLFVDFHWLQWVSHEMGTKATRARTQFVQGLL